MQRGKGRGTEVCYNVQTAVDAQHQLIVACEVTNDPGDRAWLRPMALQAKAGLDCGCAAVADVGYDHGHAVKAGLEAGITPYVPRPITSAHEKLGLCSKDDVRDDKATETDQCPAGALLTLRFDAVEHGRHSRSYATPACGGCALKPRWVDEQLLEEMEQRVRSRPEVMKQRKEWVEHSFGTMKRGWDHGYFLMRGLEKVRTECSLTILAYNLQRVLNLVQMPRLLAYIESTGVSKRGWLDIPSRTRMKPWLSRDKLSLEADCLLFFRWVDAGDSRYLGARSDLLAVCWDNRHVAAPRPS